MNKVINHAQRTIFFITGKIIRGWNQKYYAEGGFVTEVNSIAEKLGHITMISPCEKCDAAVKNGNELNQQHITMIPIAAPRSILTYPFFALLYWWRLSRLIKGSISCYCYVPSMTQVAAIAMLLCRMRHIPMVIAERGSIVRTLTNNRRLRWNEIPAFLWQWPWEYISCRWGYRSNPVFARGNQRTEELRRQGIEATPLIGGMQQYPPYCESPERKIGNFLFVGRLEVAKGAFDLLNAFGKLLEKYPQCHLEMVGKCAQEESVKKIISQYNMASQVKLSGLLAYGPDLFAAYARNAVIILPSYSEGVPNVLLEGMSSGCVACGSDIPGIRDILKHDQNGLLFPSGDVAAICRTMEKTLAMPQQDFLKLRDAGRATVQKIVEKNTFPLMIEKILGSSRQ